MPHDYNLHWTCHSCGKEIEEHESFVIIAGEFVYHTEHRPKESTGLEPIHTMAPKRKEKK